MKHMKSSVAIATWNKTPQSEGVGDGFNLSGDLAVAIPRRRR